MALRITRDLVPELLRSIENLTQTQVLIGIPGDTAPRRPDGSKGPPMNNPTLGYIHNYGSPARNIPARPFMEPGIAAAMPRIIDRLRAGARLAMRFPIDPTVPETVLNGVGLIAQNEVRRVINAGVPPALAAATIARRRSRRVAPRTGTVPLIDTGQLRNSITYVLRPK